MAPFLKCADDRKRPRWTTKLLLLSRFPILDQLWLKKSLQFKLLNFCYSLCSLKMKAALKTRANCNATSTAIWCLPWVDDSQCPGFHAVDRPVGDALIVANGDGEPAEVGPDQVDDGPFLALDLEGGAFASVLGPTFKACKKRNKNMIRRVYSFPLIFIKILEFQKERAKSQRDTPSSIFLPFQHLPSLIIVIVKQQEERSLQLTWINVSPVFISARVVRLGWGPPPENHFE